MEMRRNGIVCVCVKESDREREEERQGERERDVRSILYGTNHSQLSASPSPPYANDVIYTDPFFSEAGVCVFVCVFFGQLIN